ncbi:MAG: HAD family hydrolase, partial [Candidatus Hodarchaeota archaeon]
MNQKFDIISFRQILWSEIEYVLIDMDGTLLDLYFDDYFWEEFVPKKYAEKYNLSIIEAKKNLFAKYKAEEGTLNWTDVDYWSKTFDLDLASLKEQIKHLIHVHPYAETFLQMLKKAGKTVFLLTNAHFKSLEIKMKKTQLDIYFDAILSAFDVMFAKQQLEFW